MTTMSLLEALDVLANAAERDADLYGPDVDSNKIASALRAQATAALSRLEDLRAAIGLATGLERLSALHPNGALVWELDGKAAEDGGWWNVMTAPGPIQLIMPITPEDVDVIGFTPLEALLAALGQGQQDAGG